MKKSDFVKIASLVFVTLLAYIPTFVWMYDRWMAHDTYYSHGVLVPFISAVIVWLIRDEFAKLAIKPMGIGWMLFAVGIVIHALSMLMTVYFTSGFSLLLVLAGLVLLFLGKDYLKHLAFPILFLVFMIPLPLVAIANMSFRLKIFAAQMATMIINAVGVPAMRDGSVIKTMHSYLMVEDPCSGIRSLIALIALGALMAYFTKTNIIKRSVIFVSSIPIAVIANIFRIVALSLVSEIYGAKYATGVFHDTMGILVFVIAFAGLSVVGKMLE
jgi:exosortase